MDIDIASNYLSALFVGEQIANFCRDIVTPNVKTTK
jgi:hypothetical protein